ncbi:hypothetical protein Q2468_22965, partial [Escherichia coli]|nr:hypothetical protein [Escherichia coli]
KLESLPIIKTIYLLLTLSRYKIIISDITGSHYHLRDITLRASGFHGIISPGLFLAIIVIVSLLP